MGMSSPFSRRQIPTGIALTFALAAVAGCSPSDSQFGPADGQRSGHSISKVDSELLQTGEASAAAMVQSPEASRAALVRNAGRSSRSQGSRTSAGSNSEAAVSAGVSGDVEVVRSTASSATQATALPAGVLYFGAVGDVATLTRTTGYGMALHTYGNFAGSVPAGQMITVNASGAPWRTVRDAVPGSKLHSDMVRWANTLKARGGRIEVAFGHEPELSSKARLGSPEEYKTAYQNVVKVFRSQGVTNVAWVFQATDWGFRTVSSDPYYAGRFYPGDSYVDIIGGDAYNWHTCGEGRGKNVPLSTVASGVLSFAKAHGKKASLPEFAANTTVDRSKWLADGFAWLKANSSVFTSAYYFQHPPTNPANFDCNWPLRTQAEFSAIKAIMADGLTRP